LYILGYFTLGTETFGAYMTLFYSALVEMILTTFIKLIHLLVFLFLVAAPFTGSEYLMSMHLLIVPFILIHWLTNQSVCALTEIEKLVTGTRCDEETFFGKVVGPIYKFRTQKEENLFVWTAMITLWVLTFVRLQMNGFAHLRADIRAMRQAWPF
jgi:hypothetical protein